MFKLGETHEGVVVVHQQLGARRIDEEGGRVRVPEAPIHVASECRSRREHRDQRTTACQLQTVLRRDHSDVHGAERRQHDAGEAIHARFTHDVAFAGIPQGREPHSRLP